MDAGPEGNESIPSVGIARMSKIRVNGVKVTADWPAKIEAAQTLTYYTIGKEKFGRIRFGDDYPGRGGKPCLDCAVLNGQFHVLDCEYEKCPACGQSMAGGCSCDIEELREPSDETSHDEVEARQRRVRNFNRVCWVFVVGALLALARSIALLFGI
jgi:hypothetical protein